MGNCVGGGDSQGYTGRRRYGSLNSTDRVLKERIEELEIALKDTTKDYAETVAMLVSENDVVQEKLNVLIQYFEQQHREVTEDIIANSPPGEKIPGQDQEGVENIEVGVGSGADAGGVFAFKLPGSQRSTPSPSRRVTAPNGAMASRSARFPGGVLGDNDEADDENEQYSPYGLGQMGQETGEDGLPLPAPPAGAAARQSMGPGSRAPLETSRPAPPERSEATGGDELTSPSAAGRRPKRTPRLGATPPDQRRRAVRFLIVAIAQKLQLDVNAPPSQIAQAGMELTGMSPNGPYKTVISRIFALAQHLGISIDAVGEAVRGVGDEIGGENTSTPTNENSAPSTPALATLAE